MKSKGLFMIAVAAGLVLTGCGVVPIGKVLRDPTRYRNRSVQVEGTVVNSFGALSTGAYEIQDETGKIYVISGTGVPQKGSRVQVSGMVASGVTVMGKSFGTTIRESRHKVK